MYKEDRHVTLTARSAFNATWRGMMVLEDLAANGFDATFDFLYLPIDQVKNKNKGYAFVNFLDPSLARKFKLHYAGRWPHCGTMETYPVMAPSIAPIAPMAHCDTIKTSRVEDAPKQIFVLRAF